MPKENHSKEIEIGLTFDDVLLVPAYSNTLPKDVNTETLLTENITLNIPIVSAAMDTVTESRLAIALAREGGIGIIHRAFSIKEQVAEVEQVKKSESGMIINPITISPEQKIGDAFAIMSQYHISGIPVVLNNKLVGILTNRDLRFEKRMNLRVSEVMTKENLITVPEGTTLMEAREILQKNRIEKLPVVNKKFELKGLITIKDIEKQIVYPYSCKDKLGRLRVGAAVGVGRDSMERVDALVKVGVDVIIVDTAHGHAQSVLDTVKNIRRKHPRMEIIGGNISTGEAALALIKAGVNGLKVGVGPGSICTTRIVAGAGVPQITAISKVAEIAEKAKIPVIADGGIKFSGDITKAIAAGANTVMIGGMFAGTEESPGESVIYQGRSYKVYRGMGSLGAMERGGRDRYFQEGEPQHKLVPEGIEGRVPYKGSMAAIVYQLVGGLRSGMGYCGCDSIADLRKKGKFIRLTQAGLRESHAHDVIITKEAPNYQREWDH
ncbi:MAG: IMP dehydrogenase [Nitrospiria bacterium]